MPQSRTIAIGDIHGHAAALGGLLDLLAPQEHDQLVFLGDYIDHGPDSKRVIDCLLALQQACQVVTLMGNHEEIALAALTRASALQAWLEPGFGGQATLGSYGPEASIADLPPAHVAFLRGLHRFHETESHFFMHANYAPNWQLADHDSRTAMWLSLEDCPQPHYSGKVAIVGHTPQGDGRILDLGYLKCIDTGCGYGGWLTALDVGSGQLWQVDEQGRKRC